MRQAAADSHELVYAAEYKQGALAADDDPCPYPIWQLGRRCAWLGGYWDARRRGFA